MNLQRQHPAVEALSSLSLKGSLSHLEEGGGKVADAGGGTGRRRTSSSLSHSSLEVVDGPLFFKVLKPDIIARESALYEAPEVDGPARQEGEVVEISRAVLQRDGRRFLQLAWGEGWLYDKDEEGNTVLLDLDGVSRTSEGDFFYKVKTLTELRRGPDYAAIVRHTDTADAKRPALHEGTIVHCDQLITLPESTVTWGRLKYHGGYLPLSLLDGTQVLEPLAVEPETEAGTFHYLVEIPVAIREGPSTLSRRTGEGFPLLSIVQGSLLYREPGSTVTYVKLSDNRGWVFERLEDGRQVLKRLPRGVVWEEKRQFFYLSKDSLVYSRPEFPSDTTNKRVRGTVAECSERLITADGAYAFVKLRYSDGWLMQQSQREVLLELIDEAPVESYESSWFKVNRPLSVRMGPDIYSRTAPGSSTKPVGSIVQVDMLYSPPKSRVSYLRLQNERGWLVERNEDGNPSLSPVAGGSREDGTFYFRTLTDCLGRIAPDNSSAAVRTFPAFTMFRADCKLSVPSLEETFVRVYGQQLWVQAEENGETKTEPLLEEVPRQIFRLYSTPQPWLAIGRPERVWYKVPTDEGLAVLAEEALLAFKTFEKTRVLGAASCGRELVPLRRFGYFITDANKRNTVIIEEIKHSGSNLSLSYAAKQIWWIFRLDGEVHSVELHHSLQGGGREVKLDGKTVLSSRPLSSLLWDKGSEHTFSLGSHTIALSIALEGSFFSFDLQYFTYQLSIDGQPMRQLTPGEEIDFEFDAGLDL